MYGIVHLLVRDHLSMHMRWFSIAQSEMPGPWLAGEPTHAPGLAKRQKILLKNLLIRNAFIIFYSVLIVIY